MLNAKCLYNYKEELYLKGRNIIMNKKEYIEGVRIFAILFVVLIHVVAIPLRSWSGDTVGSYQIYSLIYVIGSCGVPLFLMITGSLLLNPAKEISLNKIYCKMIPRILIPLFVWGWVFACMEIYFETRMLTISMPFQALYRVLNNESWAHLWYLYMLLGVYIFLPLMKHLSDTLSEKMYLYTTYAMIIVGYILPTINKVCGINITISVPLPLCYFATVWMGYFVERYKENKIYNKILYIFGSVSAVVLIISGIMNGVFGKNYYDVIAQYDNIFVLGTAILIYMVVRKCLQNKSLPKWLLSLAGCSFGIYLLHPVIINMLYKVVNIRPTNFNAVISIPVFAIMFIVPVWFAVYIMKKIPFIKHLV